MNEPTMNNMVQRLDRLERENRRLKLLGSLVLIGIATLLLMGQAKPNRVAKVIEAEKFILRDSSGSERARSTRISITGYGAWAPDRAVNLRRAWPPESESSLAV